MKNHDLEYISRAYGVPAHLEQRVEYITTAGKIKTGRIVGARGQYLRLHFDGEPKDFPVVFHPTDGIRYLND